MNQNNDYNQFGFDHYSQSGAAPRGGAGKLLGPTLGEKLRSPLFAGAALLLTGAAFAAIIVASYPSGDAQTPVVVKAETLAYKEAPENPGGMEIANRDSTVFSSMRDEAMIEAAPVENLLAGSDQAEKLERFAAQVEEAVEAEEQAVMARVETTTEAPVEDLTELAPASGEAEPAPIELKKIVEKVEEKPAEAATQAVAAAESVIETPTKPLPRIHKAGENPETLEFVRSVLDKKDGKTALDAPATNDTTATAASDVATQMSNIEPAAGVSGVDIRPGDHYVQVGSVRSATGAEGEWGKIQKSFDPLLSGVSHRVKSADLGDRGTFYRIQAGPMSKESASALCDQIKAQKPGGCLVTK